jgi:plasmid stabilization system protein ParE
MGHYREDLLDRRYRFWNFYFSVVCYAWAPKPIQIVAVVHGARQLASFFESRPSPEQTS